MDHPRFDQLVLVIVIISSVALILDSPFEQRPDVVNALRVADWVFTCLFTLELVLKALSLGVPRLLRDPGNVMDAVVVAVSLAVLAAEAVAGPASLAGAQALGAVKALRALRALRPLRLISRNPGMRLVIDVVYRSIPAVSNVLLIFALFLLIFSILGVQLFAGRLGACSDAAVLHRKECVGDFVDGDGARQLRVWANPAVGNFDNVLTSALVLFEMTSLEMWPDVMFATVNASPTEVDVGPVRDANPAAVLFSVAWIVVGAFFMLQLFVGAVIEQFNRARAEEDGRPSLLTPAQREWVHANQMITALRVAPRSARPSGPIRRACYAVARHAAFEACIATAISLNAISVAAVHLGQPAELTLALRALNYTFSAVFFVEAVIKVVAEGLRQYLASAWNWFDGLLVVVAVVDIAVDLALDMHSPDAAVVRVIRIVRVARMVRLVRFRARTSAPRL